MVASQRTSRRRQISGLMPRSTTRSWRTIDAEGAESSDMGSSWPPPHPADRRPPTVCPGLLLLSRGLLAAERDDYATGCPLVYPPTPRLLQLLGVETLEEARWRMEVPADHGSLS